MGPCGCPLSSQKLLTVTPRTRSTHGAILMVLLCYRADERPILSTDIPPAKLCWHDGAGRILLQTSSSPLLSPELDGGTGSNCSRWGQFIAITRSSLSERGLKPARAKINDLIWAMERGMWAGSSCPRYMGCHSHYIFSGRRHVAMEPGLPLRLGL